MLKQFKMWLSGEHYFDRGRTVDQHFLSRSFYIEWGSTEHILFKKQKWIDKLRKSVKLSILERDGPSM